MFYRINWKASTKTVLLETGAVSAPAVVAGYVDAGSFQHGPDKDDDTQLSGAQHFTDNHVLYHHVQEALYKLDHEDMQSVSIHLDRLRTISIGTGTVNLVVGATSQLTAVPTPTNANGKVTWASSDPTKATVSATGLVTGVAAGNATITATSATDDTVTATRAVTVTAA